MTQSEALQVFGSEITGRYFSSITGDYETFTLSYVNPWVYAYGVHSAGNSWTYEGDTFLLYSASGLSISSNPQYISLDIQPTYSFFDTEQIHTVIAMHSGGESAGISTTYQSPAWDWYFNGSPVHLENADESETVGTHAFIRSDGRAFQYVCADFSSTTATSGYSYRATFSGHSGSYCYLLIGLPYISDSASGATGTFTTSSGSSGGDTNITVNVDMSETNEKIDETNGILSTIHSWLSSFFSTLGTTVLSWFMPSQNFLSNWVSEIMDTIEEHFSPWPILNERITTIIENIMTTMGEGGAESVEFPAINVPLDVPGQDPNASFSLSSQSVPLFPQGTSPIRDLLKDGLDMVCTIWVFNMVLNRIKAKILGEQVVEIEGVQEE